MKPKKTAKKEVIDGYDRINRALLGAKWQERDDLNVMYISAARQNRDSSRVLQDDAGRIAMLMSSGAMLVIFETLDDYLLQLSLIIRNRDRTPPD